MFYSHPMPVETCGRIYGMLASLPESAWRVDNSPRATPDTPPKMLLMGLSKHATNIGCLVVSPTTALYPELRDELLEIVFGQVATITDYDPS